MHTMRKDQGHSRVVGDELRLFDSGPDSWKMLAGRAGIALIRDGKVIANIVSMMN